MKSLDDLADLASDELIEILGADAMDEDTANAVIMAAREHWFAADDGSAEEAAAETDAVAEAEPTNADATGETADDRGASA